MWIGVNIPAVYYVTRNNLIKLTRYALINSRPLKIKIIFTLIKGIFP